MTRFISVAGAAVAALSLGACAQLGIGGWTTLVDGTKGLENFNRVGEANWVATDGAIQASTGGKDPGYLVTKVPYKDFQMRVEFWASDDANSGIFMRCQNPSRSTTRAATKPTSSTSGPIRSMPPARSSRWPSSTAR